jgi:hypothetical protein
LFAVTGPRCFYRGLQRRSLRGREPRQEAQRKLCTMSLTADELRKAIENLIDAKLHDALYRPGGLDRLRAHRMTGVASPDIRAAERRLEDALTSALVPQPPVPSYRRRPRKIEGVELISTD